MTFWSHISSDASIWKLREHAHPVRVFFSVFYFFVADGKVVDAIGYKRTIVVGLFIDGLAARFIRRPGPPYPFFLVALIVSAQALLRCKSQQTLTSQC